MCRMHKYRGYMDVKERCSFAYFSVAYMDVGKGREQDAEALL